MILFRERRHTVKDVRHRQVALGLPVGASQLSSRSYIFASCKEKLKKSDGQSFCFNKDCGRKFKLSRYILNSIENSSTDDLFTVGCRKKLCQSTPEIHGQCCWSHA